ncbi:MAG TPA: copper amine oxidase N-terminal domain-containing protein [Capsulimonadaceae bacterium]|nr:copper amine oxidase N-terminal domain-containing protein [Capsulimonadaceae bacterium]
MRFHNNKKLALGAIAGAFFAAGALAYGQTTTTIVRHHVSDSDSDSSGIRITVNHEPVTFQGAGPVMVDGAVMVPVRGVFEQMGGDVQWMPKAKVVEGSRPGHMFRLRLGSDQALVDGNMHDLSSPPKLIDGTTYIPLRFASEALGARVRWHGPDRTVIITTDAPGETTTKSTTTTTTTTNP